jgi:aromatic-L-amino-acid/L-tryptophan decarboxylase
MNPLAEKEFSLDLPGNTLQKTLEETLAMLLALQKNLEDKKVYHQKEPSQVAALFDEVLPDQPQAMSDILQEVANKVIPNSTLNIGPYFQAYVMSCSNHAGFIGQVISTFLNQNATKWHLGPASAELEQVIIRWIKAFMQLPVNTSGVLVSGGSAANLTCLTVARNAMMSDIKKQGLFGQPPLVIYASTEVHHCISKSAQLLGIGSEQVHKIAVNDDFTMDLEALRDQIAQDLSSGFRPFCVVASAGTVNTGAIDPLTEIAALCKQYRLWFHVDGAYGGLAAGLPGLSRYYRGLAEADSIAVDPHKWLYVPFEAGCALFKDEQLLPATFGHVPDYLSADKTTAARRDYMEYGFQLSRSDKALKIWMTFKGQGAENLRKAIALDVEKALYLAQLLKDSPLFEVLTAGPLSVTCYRLNPPELNLSTAAIEALNKRLLAQIEKDGQVFITGTKLHGQTALRSCFVNHRVQRWHLDYTFQVLSHTAEQVLRQSADLY